MFSAAATRPMTRTPEGRSLPNACIAPITAAPPDMSYFIFSMDSAGLSEMPPVSNVMPLPTMQIVFFTRPLGLYSITMKRGGCAEPRPTPRMAPIFMRFISSGP